MRTELYWEKDCSIKWTQTAFVKTLGNTWAFNSKAGRLIAVSQLKEILRMMNKSLIAVILNYKPVTI